MARINQAIDRYKVIVGAMFLIGGIGIAYFLYSSLMSKKYDSKLLPVDEEITDEPQWNRTPFPRSSVYMPSDKEHSDTVLDAGSRPADISSAGVTEEVQGEAVELSGGHSGKEKIAARIKKLETELEELTGIIEDIHQRRLEVGKMIQEQASTGREELIEELKELQELEKEARKAGQTDLADEIREHRNEVNENYGKLGEELRDEQDALIKQLDPIAEQMAAIRTELKSLKEKQQAKGLQE